MTHTNNNNYQDKKSTSELEPFLALLEQGDRVLDLGCGNGIDLAWFSKSGLVGVGIDSSDEMVALARTVHAQSGIEILQKNFLFLTLSEAEFDGVWANLSFPYLAPEELQRLLAICFKGVRVGGVIGAILYEGSGKIENLNLYTEKALCSMFEQTGFQVKKIGRQQKAHDQLSKILILAERV